jgi:hypothetical protein
VATALGMHHVPDGLLAVGTPVGTTAFEAASAATCADKATAFGVQGASTPEPQDQVFEEDGITYRWNASLRKYVPDDLPEAELPAQKMPEYTAEMMQFAGDTEPTVTLEEARAAEEESAALAENLEATQGQKVRILCAFVFHSFCRHHVSCHTMNGTSAVLVVKDQSRCSRRCSARAASRGQAC